VGSSSHGFTDPDLKPVRMKKEQPEMYEVFNRMASEE